MKKYKLAFGILGAFILAACWVAAGRILFGVFGWMFFILLFTIIPLIAMYGIALAIVVAVRQRSFVYRSKGPFMVALYVTLFALFILGLSIPDGGDTKESGGSALTVLMGDKSSKEAIGVSGSLAGWSIFIAVVASVVTFVLAFFERTKRTHDTSAANALKQSS